MQTPDPNPFQHHPDGPWEERHRPDVERRVGGLLDAFDAGTVTLRDLKDDHTGIKHLLWWQHHPRNERWKLLGRPYWSVEAYRSWRRKFLATPSDGRFDRRGNPHLRTFPKRSKDGLDGLLHEHVVPKKAMLEWLLRRTDPIPYILDRNIGAVITRREDQQCLPRRYRSSHPDPHDPWLRYQGSGITFIENPTWSEAERKALNRHGLLAG